MSDLEKRVNPNATIQIDKIDAAELVDLEEEAAAKAAPPSVARRTAPPPLPLMPAVATAEDRPSAAQTPPLETRGGKKVLYGAAFVALLAAAILGGLAFGARMRGEARAASAAPPPPSAAASASSHTLTVPAVEITGP